MKALFIGLGGIGQRHLRNFRAALGSESEVLAFRVRGRSSVLTDQLQIDGGKDLAATYNLRVFDNLADALSQRPGAAFICNPTSLHVPAALEAARAGCHLFIEKPLSHTLEQIQQLIDVVTGRNLVAVVGYQLRFHPLLREARELLASGAIGQVLAARLEIGERITRWHPYEDYRQMYASRRDQGGGVILSQIHEIDYAQWLFGPPERVFAIGGKLSSLEVDVEDVASILMQCRVNGRVVPVHLHQDYVQDPPSRSCQVIGDAGKLVVNLREQSLLVHGPDGRITVSRTIEGFDRNQMFVDEMADFIRQITARDKSQGCGTAALGCDSGLVSLSDGAQSLRTALAARLSLETGQVVETR